MVGIRKQVAGFVAAVLLGASMGAASVSFANFTETTAAVATPLDVVLTATSPDSIALIGTTSTKDVTVTLTNSNAGSSSTVDSVTAEIPTETNFAYLAGSTKVDAVAASDPTYTAAVAGPPEQLAKLVFTGPFTVPASGTVVITFKVTITNPTTSGTRSLAITGLQGTDVVDTTADPTTTDPASVVWTIPSAPTITANSTDTSKGRAVTLTPAVTVDAAGTWDKSKSVVVDYGADAVAGGGDDTVGTTVTQAGKGAWTVNTTTGAYTFTPEAAFLGTAKINYRAFDSYNQSVDGVMTVVVIPNTAANDVKQGYSVAAADAAAPAAKTWTMTAPIVVLQSGVTMTNLTFTTSTCNLTGAGADTVFGTPDDVCTGSPASIGTWSYNAGTKELSFTRNANLVLTQSVKSVAQYTVTDSMGDTAVATASVYVVAKPTVANKALAGVLKESQTSSAILFDDVVVAAGATLDKAATRFMYGSPLAIWSDPTLTITGAGVWSLDVSGASPSVTYAPTASGISVDGLKTVTVRIFDSMGGYVDATVSVTVAKVPTVPATALAASGKIVGTTITNAVFAAITPTISPNAAWTNSAVNLTGTGITSSAANTWTHAGTGTWTYNPTTQVFTFAPLANFTGVATATYKAVDSLGQESNAGTLNATIVKFAAPTITIATPTKTVNYLSNNGAALTFTATATVDTAKGATFNESKVGFKTGAGNAIAKTKTSATPSGTWSITGTAGAYTVTFTPDAGLSGTGTMDVWVTDSEGQEEKATVTVTLTANTAVTLFTKALKAPGTAVAANICEAAVGQLPAGRTCDPVTLKIKSGTTTTTSLTVPNAGEWKVAAGELSFTPATNAIASTVSTQYVFQDNLGTWYEGTLAVEITGAATGTTGTGTGTTGTGTTGTGTTGTGTTGTGTTGTGTTGTNVSTTSGGTTSLPRTGSNVAAASLLGAVLAAGGYLLMLTGRRRKTVNRA